MKLNALALIVPFLVCTSLSARAEGTHRLINEGERELGLMTTTRYQHQTDVDEAKGQFDYDCSGFLDYAIERSGPRAYPLIPIAKPGEPRPLASDFYALFSSLPSPAAKPWVKIRKAIDLKPGDIIAWLKPDDVDSKNTGHVMLVRERAIVNPAMDAEILVRVIDSSKSGHADDTRTNGAEGLGSGTVGILIDSSGQPIGYRWRGGISTKTELTAIAFGRIEIEHSTTTTP